MQEYFRISIFLAVLVLMIIGVGQPSRAALDKPEYDSSWLFNCQRLNLECFFSVAGKKSDEHKCTAEYRRCIAHCK